MKEMAGHVYGRLKVLSVRGRSKSGQYKWLCRCSCGTNVVVFGDNLRRGHTQSCGCLNIERTVESNRRHGHARRAGYSLTYKSWQHMLDRCLNPKNNMFSVYGGAGVRVCKRWRTFKNFYLDMGKRPQGTTLGRYLDRGDYKKSNCAWMTRAQQGAERRKKRRTT